MPVYGIPFLLQRILDLLQQPQIQEAAAAEHDGEMLRVERSALIQRHRAQCIHEPGRDALMRDPRFLILHQRADHRAPVKDPHAVSFLDDERVGRRL